MASIVDPIGSGCNDLYPTIPAMAAEAHVSSVWGTLAAYSPG
jgi:hypothetical protein